MTSLAMWNFKKPNSEKQRAGQWLPRAERWGYWGDAGQRFKTSSYITSSGDLMHNMVTIDNNTVLYT